MEKQSLNVRPRNRKDFRTINRDHKTQIDLSVKLLVNTIAVYRSFTDKPYYQYENVRHD